MATLTRGGHDGRLTSAPHRAPASRAALVSWALYDWANSGFSTVVETFVFAAYFTRQVAPDEATGSVLWGNTVSAASLVVALTGPMVGAIADQGGRRKPGIAVFTAWCVVATAMLWTVRPDAASMWPAMLLVGMGIVGSELAGVLYNAMLADLVPPDRLGRWSGWGWSAGYAGGLVCLVVALLAFIQGGGAWLSLDAATAEPVRATFVLTAVWFAVFALPLLLVTPDVPATGVSAGAAVQAGFRQLADSLREVRRYRDIVRFLVARMLYIDGLGTVFAFGGVYAAGTFDMTEQQVLLFGIALNLTAGLGAAGFAWVDDWLGAERTIVLSLVGLIVAASAMLLVESQPAFWVFGMLLGVFVGPVQASGRSYLARVAPPALRTQMFGLYALSGKATAFVGPLVVGWVTWGTGSQRVGMASVLVLFGAGLVLMLTLPGVGGSLYKRGSATGVPHGK
ncbi:MAG TPA: MFS transporter [Candidatus Binatia bacterium]|nr:MFS transporter [Candidatus Binatia bacterium]